MELIVKDNGRKIKFNSNVISVFEKYKQISKDDFEAGGILIAREDKNNNNIMIEFITEPLKNDVRKKYRYYRKDIEHIKFCQKLYKEKGGIYVYIGEWHTHPEDYPTPSYLDKNNWNKIFKKYKSIRTNFYNVIVGIQEIRVWKCNNNIERIF